MSRGQIHRLEPEEVERRLLPLLQAGAEVPLVVTGESMRPFLRDRQDTVFLRGREFVPIRNGDILFFRRGNGQWTLHRFCRKCADGTLVVNGDAQTWTERIRPEQVAGVAVRIRRGERPPVSARRWPGGVIVWLWTLLRPVRPYLLAGLSRLRKWRSIWS
ncbi:S24/S26 family peptidase [Flavonifractor hominis]|uniref:S24/S26 family peptidase n=1 Tax=Flavonifractor hominis TaxID=3133178 RepID=A0ABV1EML1_9FIRM